MKTNLHYTYAIFALLLFSFTSCTKEAADALADSTTNCSKLATLKAHGTSVVKGGTITLTADTLNDNTDYFWSGPGNYQSYYQSNTVTTSADYSYRGWYYVRISNSDCSAVRFDSVYVNVTFPQGAASCSPVNNSSTFNSPLILGTQNYSSLSFGPGSSEYEVTGNSSNGDMTLRFSQYWFTHNFEDGIYYTTSDPIPDDIDAVYISAVNQSIFWVAEPNKPVYVSHAGSKVVITYCGIQFSGDWGGTLYHATVNTKITQP